MKTHGVLRQLGFNKLSEKIYDILLHKGALSIAEIARASGKHRPAIYKAIPALVSDGLTSSYRKGKRILYRVESPAIILSLLKQRHELVESQLPEYIRTFETKNKGLKISSYEGERGIKDVYEYLMKTTPKHGVFRRIESPRDYHKNKKYYPALYWSRAGSLGDIEKYVITNSYTHNRRRKNLSRSSKPMPESAAQPFDYNITQIVDNNKVIIVDYDTESAFVIENERFAAFQKHIFDNLFKKI